MTLQMLLTTELKALRSPQSPICDLPVQRNPFRATR
jgi:hypothetical protein